MSQVLLTAFSNRLDAVQLAHEAQAHLHSHGVSSALHLLDLDTPPDIDSTTLVISLGGDEHSCSRPVWPTRFVRGCSRSISVASAFC